MLDTYILSKIFVVISLLADTLPNGDIETWTQLAYKFGPFFFTILLLCFLLWRFTAASRAPNANKLYWRRLITSTYVIGIILMGFCIYWWATHQSPYIFSGKINDLTSYEKLGGNDFFFKNEWKTLAGDTTDLRRNVHFLLVQENPFHDGQSFDLEFAKGPSSSNSKFQIVYDSHDPNPIYEIVWSEENQRNELRKLSTATSLNRPAIPRGSAFAQERPQPIAAAKVHVFMSDKEILSVLGILQDERSDVGSKIDAIDRMLKEPSERIEEVLKMRTSKESVIVTLYDLSNHSDRELASKARRVLKVGEATNFIAAQLNNPNPKQRTEAKKIIERIPREDAEVALTKVESQNSTSAQALKTILDQLPVMEVKPTGSPSGDRYYVKATWDPGDTQTVVCLTELFNHELISDRSLEQEEKLMQGRSTRLVYWYSKDWAFRIADLITGCGAKADFVHP